MMVDSVSRYEACGAIWIDQSSGLEIAVIQGVDSIEIVWLQLAAGFLILVPTCSFPWLPYEDVHTLGAVENTFHEHEHH